ncbi:four helix bundle protein [Alloacidobacterium dinghuense]|uniref:Four helix bundle protein n=1 Tax=Alloacidobacterium dinghuense TaxID=2763107 RepID=A0A7G8BH94_9BACT|nr:four helix bundle protein [Alloacidobacterium dinghuense]QNI31914.1 four helix bundle protein [Alloacidobacterium dinghuense]
MKTKHFRDLLVWQRSMKLAQEIYGITQNFPKTEMFGLTSQLRRSAVSVPSNIAEGHGRLSDKAFAVFLGHARGSLFEMETQIELAFKLGFIRNEELDLLLQECTEIARMLNGLLTTLSTK